VSRSSLSAGVGGWANSAVHIVEGDKLPVSEFVDVEIVASSDHDLEAKLAKPS
jgi:hypothetical protein